MSLAALAQRLNSGPVPPVPSVNMPEGTENRLSNQHGSPGSPGSPEKTTRVEVSGEEPLRLWLATLPNGERFSVSCTPPATLADLQGRFPGATIEPEPEPAAGAALHPADQSIAYALLRHWNETDMEVGEQWIAGLARDPERLRQMYAEAVRLGIATLDPPPEQPIETRATGAVCARCDAFEPSPVNPEGGMGRCLTDAPASRKAGSLWPWADAEIRCNCFEPKPAAPETTTKGSKP